MVWCSLPCDWCWALGPVLASLRTLTSCRCGTYHDRPYLFPPTFHAQAGRSRGLQTERWEGLSQVRNSRCKGLGARRGLQCWCLGVGYSYGARGPVGSLEWGCQQPPVETLPPSTWGCATAPCFQGLHKPGRGRNVEMHQ